MIGHTLPIFSILILKKANQVLLLKRSHDARFAPSLYCFVGGAVEQTETFRQAIIREAQEEVGITINQDDLHFAHVFHKQTNGIEIVVCVFECYVWDGEPYNKEQHKHSEMLWVDQNMLPEDMVPAHKSAIEQVNLKSYYSEQQ